jgi:pimeloyl-ACP methyl ester carboxylesterase
MTAERLTVPAADGRTLEVLTLGPADGLPFVFHAGTPGGLVGHGPITEPAVGLGLRTVLYARPGYGASTQQPGRLVADAAADVVAILDHLGAGSFVTAGWSGGGPHALACAALLPGRCLAAASIAGIAPAGAEGLDWLGDMAPENVQEFAAAADGEAALSSLLEAAADELRDITPAALTEGLGGLVSDADKAVVSGDFAGYLAASFHAALASGIAGWRDDDLAFVRDWGFALSGGGNGAGAPVTIWQGGQDRMVPFAHGAWLAGQLPGARARLLPGEGHLTLAATAFSQILADLLDLAGVRPAGPGGQPA